MRERQPAPRHVSAGEAGVGQGGAPGLLDGSQPEAEFREVGLEPLLLEGAAGFADGRLGAVALPEQPNGAESGESQERECDFPAQILTLVCVVPTATAWPARRAA